MAALETIAIIGGGLMGHGIAQVFAVAAHPVRVYDVNPAVRASVQARIARNLMDLGGDPAAALRVAVMDDFGEAVAGADLVIEAGPEDLDWKQKTFERLELIGSPDAVFASNTSVLPISRIVAHLPSKHRMLGTHWWNPPFLVPLVEVIKTDWTAEQAALRVFQLLAQVGKTPAMVHRDVAGFIGNRLQHALWREAVALVADGVCDAETVDTVVKASFGRRLPVLGPLENADLVGTDLTLAIHRTVLPAINSAPIPSPYLERLVKDGRLGMKSGEGFRRWTTEEQEAVRRRVLSHLQVMSAADRADAHR